MDITDEMLKASSSLHTANVSHALCGGLAVAIHGRPRMTADIDFVVAAADMERATDALLDIGFDDNSGWVPIKRNHYGISRLYRLNKFDGEAFLTIDLLEVSDPNSDILASCVVFELSETKVVVVSKEALIKMKTDTGRTKDLLDIEMLTDDAK